MPTLLPRTAGLRGQKADEKCLHSVSAHIPKRCTFETGHASLLRFKNNVKHDISEEDFAYDVEAYCIRCQEVQKQQEKNQGKQKYKSNS